MEVPGEVPAKNGLRAKDTDDSRMFSHISKLGNLYSAQVGGSKDACCLIGEGKPQIAVRRFAIGHQTFRDNQIAGLDHGTGHLASMSPPENQRLDTDKG